MDGIGFALERFDALGKVREKDGEFPIDDKGAIPGSEPFRGLDGLKKILDERKPQMVRNLIRKLMTYALGRGLAPGDRRAVELCAQQLVKSGWHFSSLALAIVNSDPFL